ncbi:MAG: tRNA uridine-5-carboxymethylaminomethyl(34) synthesis GTPase MnmE [Xanthobacteraceae bacterium]|nr:tRNA uridine-5-carboxymethylaminomethyl(34) synthesis GTPase MnmE [Xanthobacteraceae bacterium]
MHPSEQTIFALSSGRPPTAIAIVRVSGARAGFMLEALSGKRPPPRVATRAWLRDACGETIDDAVVLWFPGPASATGEDVAELHVHGGRAVLASLFAALSAFEGTRPAEPGEFTRRAFENGKIDLTEAEGLDDLIHADTDRQRRQALRQLRGLLGDKARDWRRQIVEAAALIEAGIDFADESDVPRDLLAPALIKVAALRDEIEQALAASGRSERLRDGLTVAIAGAPNVGKSTLMNALARREVAIVSPYAGTTRDVIEVQLDLDGYPVTLIDTAGIRDTNDPVEREGVRRARARAAEADLVLWLAEDRPAADAPVADPAGEATRWLVRTKIDLGTTEAGAANAGSIGYAASQQDNTWERKFSISAARGDGVEELVGAIRDHAANYFVTGESAVIGRARHREMLRVTADMLRRSIEVESLGDELVAEELRAAATTLGRLLGRVDVEDMLDVIFREFCIGK